MASKAENTKEGEQTKRKNFCVQRYNRWVLFHGSFSVHGCIPPAPLYLSPLKQATLASWPTNLFFSWTAPKTALVVRDYISFYNTNYVLLPASSLLCLHPPILYLLPEVNFTFKRCKNYSFSLVSVYASLQYLTTCLIIALHYLNFEKKNFVPEIISKVIYLIVQQASNECKDKLNENATNQCYSHLKWLDNNSLGNVVE